MEAIEPEGSLDLTEYVLVLVKNKWMILLATLLVAGLFAFYAMRLQPVYRATATMIIEEERNRSPITGAQLTADSFYSQTLSFKTHQTLITSRAVLDRVIQILELAADGQVEAHADQMEVSPFREMVSRYKKNISLLIGFQRETPTYQESLTRLKGALKGKIAIVPVPDTNLIYISVEDYDPAMAKNIANAVAEAYINFNLDNRLKSSKDSMTWMSAQLYETKKKLEDAETEFLGYKQQQGLFSMEGRQNVIASQISTLNRSYQEVHSARLEIDAKLDKLARGLAGEAESGDFRALVDSPMIDTLYGQLMEAELNLARLSKIFRAKHPKMDQARTRIVNTRERFKEEVEKATNNLKAERSILYEKEQALESNIKETENDAQETNRKELKYTILQRNVEAARQLYNILLSKVEESNLTSDIDVSNIRIVESAETPGGPVRPNRKRTIFMGVLFGLMAGIGIAFLREYVDQSLNTEEDIQKYIGLPVLAVIPLADEEMDQDSGTQIAETDVASDG
ncbi:MAG: GumC family protein [Desulfobacterales bacterium]|nr:GumC family protein [Desulfobacterales bacterium]